MHGGRHVAAQSSSRDCTVIDDEAPIRQLVPMLEPEVCRVLEAPDAETGLQMIELDKPHGCQIWHDIIGPIGR